MSVSLWSAPGSWPGDGNKQALVTMVVSTGPVLGVGVLTEVVVLIVLAFFEGFGSATLLLLFLRSDCFSSCCCAESPGPDSVTCSPYFTASLGTVHRENSLLLFIIILPAL